MSIDVIINWQISERACWDFSNNITNGNVTFSKAELTEGTVAIVNCTKGELVGTNILNCIEGQWNQSLPNCSIIGKNFDKYVHGCKFQKAVGIFQAI